MLCLGTYEVLPPSDAPSQIIQVDAHIFKVASTWARAFDTLLDAYQQLAENIPLLEQYHALFRTTPRMASVLTIIYEDILEFHQTALRVFKRPSKITYYETQLIQNLTLALAWMALFKSAWKDFRARFQHILNDLVSVLLTPFPNISSLGMSSIPTSQQLEWIGKSLHHKL